MSVLKVIRHDLANLRLDQPDRGYILQLMPMLGELLGPIVDIHFVTFEPGIVRGNHLHAKATEFLLPLSGNLELGWLENGMVKTELAVPGQAGYLLPPMVGHAFRNVGDSVAMAVAFGNRAFDPTEPDRYPCLIFT